MKILCYLGSINALKNRCFLLIKYYFVDMLKIVNNNTILASVFFKKDDKYIFKARNSCCV